MMSKNVAPLLLIALAAHGVTCNPAQAEPPVRGLSWFLQRMRSVEELPALEASHTAMASTWDRSGGNFDGGDFKRIEREVTTHGVYAVQGERMPVIESTGSLAPFDMTRFGGGFSAGSILWWREAQLGDKIVLGFDAPKAGRYRVMGYFTKSRDYGIGQLYVNGEESTKVDCYDPEVIPTGPIDLGAFELMEKGNRLTVEMVGSDPEAIKDLMFGVDCLVLLNPGQEPPPQDKIATLTGGRNILLDIDGPGCLHRIFLGQVAQEQLGTRIQIFLDHAPQPTLDMPVLEFFDDKQGPFPYPLVFFKSYPGMLFPIPYAKHCRVQLVHPDYGKPEWKTAAWSNYWQLVHTTYPPDTPVKSLTWPPSESERREIELTRLAWLKAESSPPEMGRPTTEETFAMEVGETKRIELDGCGVIRQLRLAAEPATPDVLRGLRMRIFFDGAELPSVDAPVGYYFGHAHTGHGKRGESVAAVLGRRPAGRTAYDCNFHSLLLGVTNREAYSCFPMPFGRGAVLELENGCSRKIDKLQLRLDVERRDTLPADWGRFHVTWNEHRAGTPAVPKFGPQNVPGAVVLNRRGRGKYVGMMLHVDWPHELWWGEGDWLIWTDEAGWPPSYHGTGSEEYFNSGWCRFDRKAVSGFVSLRPGHPMVYSFHLNDAFQFQKNIQVVEEQMGLGEAEQIIRRQNPIWGSTAYWYALPVRPAESRN